MRDCRDIQATHPVESGKDKRTLHSATNTYMRLNQLIRYYVGLHHDRPPAHKHLHVVSATSSLIVLLIWKVINRALYLKMSIIRVYIYSRCFTGVVTRYGELIRNNGLRAADKICMAFWERWNCRTGHCPVLQCPTPFFTGPSMSSPVILVNPVQGRHQPRSASTGCVELSRVRTSIVQRSFIFYGPTVWNSLPTALHDGRLSQNTFGRHVKSHLFEQPWTSPGAVVASCDSGAA